MPTTSPFDRLLETFDALCDSFVDPRDALGDADGTRWRRLGGGLPGTSGEAYFDEPQLAEIRAECRLLAATNEFAINGHENLLSKLLSRNGALTRRGRTADCVFRTAATIA